MRLQIPADLASITPEWLTRILTTSGVIKDSSIITIENEFLGKHKGVCRLRLTYDTFEESAPKSIIAKISPQEEVGFYEKIARETDMRTPYCYYCACDEGKGSGVLLLEDLQDGHFGDVKNGVSGQQAEFIIEHLVPFHVAWWEHPDLQSMDWVPIAPFLDDPEKKEEWQQFLGDLWHRFTENFAGRIPAPIEEAWPILIQHTDKIRRQSLVQPLTLCHGDYHLGNLFFGPANGNRSLVVFDWEGLRRAQGPLDLSFFLIWNLKPELRRGVEKDLLQKYCAMLKKQGVENYSVDQCYQSYQVTVYNLMLPSLVHIGAVLGTSSNRAQTVEVVLTRTSEAIIDYPITDLI